MSSNGDSGGGGESQSIWGWWGANVEEVRWKGAQDAYLTGRLTCDGKARNWLHSLLDPPVWWHRRLAVWEGTAQSWWTKGRTHPASCSCTAHFGKSLDCNSCSLGEKEETNQVSAKSILFFRDWKRSKMTPQILINQRGRLILPLKFLLNLSRIKHKSMNYEIVSLGFPWNIPQTDKQTNKQEAVW